MEDVLIALSGAAAVSVVGGVGGSVGASTQSVVPCPIVLPGHSADSCDSSAAAAAATRNIIREVEKLESSKISTRRDNTEILIF